MAINACMTIGGNSVHAPVERAFLHDLVACCCAEAKDSVSWVKFSDKAGHECTIFVPLHVATAIADAYGEATADPEPEPLDAETVAAREHADDQTLKDAGRGHLVRP